MLKLPDYSIFPKPIQICRFSRAWVNPHYMPSHGRVMLRLILAGTDRTPRCTITRDVALSPTSAAVYGFYSQGKASLCLFVLQTRRLLFHFPPFTVSPSPSVKSSEDSPLPGGEGKERWILKLPKRDEIYGLNTIMLDGAAALITPIFFFPHYFLAAIYYVPRQKNGEKQPLKVMNKTKNAWMARQTPKHTHTGVHTVTHSHQPSSATAV